MKPEANPEFMGRFETLFNQGLTYPEIARRLGLSRSKAAEIGKTYLVRPFEHRNTAHNYRKKGETK